MAPPSLASFTVNYLLESWRAVKRHTREALDGENNGSLRPVVDVLTGPQMQGCLMALLPAIIAIESGNLVVDMFIISSLVTFAMACIALVGSTIRKIIDDDSAVANERNLSVKVEFHRLDKWGEAQENLHWKALAWLINSCSKAETKGEFRMIPYVPENDDSDSDTDESDSEDTAGSSRARISIPHFHIMPLNDRELQIEHDDAKFICQFDMSQQAQNNDQGDKKKSERAADPLINREPPILIRRIDEETASLEWMQNFLNKISKVYAKQQASKKKRARYERPADCSWWSWVQNLHSCRGLSSVALDETQETLLLKDLETFAKDKDFYKRMGLPYRRGYLFSGKPGTGKTSLINAISATYNRDLYYINLQDIKTDNELQSAFASVPKNSIIVFEDIDAQSAEVHTRERRFALKKVDKMLTLKEKEKELKKKKREEKENKLLEEKSEDENEDSNTNDENTEKEKKPKKKLTLTEIWKDDEDDFFGDDLMGFGGFGGGFGPKIGPSTGFGGGIGSGMDFGDLKLGKGSLFSGFTLSMLLNCLDGHMMEENIIVIMTTNHPEVLDPALIRPGRIDLHLSLGYCTRYQLNRMYQSVMDDKDAMLDFSKYAVPEHVIAPCDALRVMILYRSNPSVIPMRLMERATELLDGKPLTTGIQAGEGSLAASDSFASLDSAVFSDDTGLRERKGFADGSP
ncbi:mitochondrial chaperone [Entophlyctis luteolus]|nr:mitochondrial chaperone [Entophlyctis luteolus]